MNNFKVNPNSIYDVKNKNKKINPNNKPNSSTNDFQKILNEKVNKNKEIKFSKHANKRLEERNVEITKSDLSKIDKAIDKASEKGIKETLILMDNKAFIASVNNKTVITATTETNLKDSVFTNIDGAIIV